MGSQGCAKAPGSERAAGSGDRRRVLGGEAVERFGSLAPDRVEGAAAEGGRLRDGSGTMRPKLVEALAKALQDDAVVIVIRALEMGA